MKKSFLLLSISSLLSAPTFSKDISFSNPQTILPNEDVQSFELADLDGNGKQEIVYLTSNGELKYAALGHYITESSRDLLRSTKWVVKDRTDIMINFDNSSFTLIRGGIAQRSPLHFRDGTFIGDTHRKLYILIDYISDTEISGKFMFNDAGISDKVSFTAIPK